MSKLILILVIPMMFFASAVSAQNYGLNQTAGNANYDTTGKTDVYSLVQILVNALLAILSIVFFALVTYGGIIWMKASGREEEVNRAKTMIEQAVIGLAVLMAAYAITTFVFKSLNQ